MAEINRISGLAPPGDLRGVDRIVPVRPVRQEVPSTEGGGRGAGARSRGGEEQVAAPATGGGGALSSGEDARITAVDPVAFDRLAPSGDPRQDVAQRLGEVLKEVLGDDFNSRRLSIDQDEATGRFVYKVIDIDTGEVVRQFPPEEILRIVASIRDAEGLVIDSKA